MAASLLPVEEILAVDRSTAGAAMATIGASRDGRGIEGCRLGSGPLAISLVGGCHADEPVGPWTLERLAAWLARLPEDHPAVAGYTWSIVPHVNPAGAVANAGWTGRTVSLQGARGPGLGFDPVAYLRSVVREAPGDDVEFGFPRDPGDAGARPENRALAAFLAEGAPYALHASLHGMGFAAGPWFLMEEAWIERTGAMRDRLRRAVRDLGYAPLDVDRGGEKGFRRIDEGFSTRPDSAAMRAHFEARGDAGTAALFRPSSMETVRALGGDPLTLVSEMPLFLAPRETGRDAGARERFKAWAHAAVAGREDEPARAALTEAGVRPMPIGDQMRLQLEMIDAGIEAVAAADQVGSGDSR